MLGLLGVLALVLVPLAWLALESGDAAPEPGGDPASAAAEVPTRPERVPLPLGQLPPLPGDGPLVVELFHLGPAQVAALRPKLPGSLEGMVMGLAGEALPDVLIEVVGGPLDGARVRSGPDGRYRFPELLPGTHFFRFDLGATRPVRQQRVLARAATQRDFRFGAPLAVRFLVRDFEGKPLAGARVENDLGAFAAVTDASGIAALPAITSGPRVLIDVHAAGHVPTRFEINLLAALATAEPVDLGALERGGAFVGEVKSWPGGPLPTVSVVPRVDRPEPNQAIWETWQGVSTDNSGFFRLEGLPTTRLVDVRVFHPEGVSDPPLLAKRADPNQAVRLSFVITGGGRRIGGKVVEAGGAPLAGATVRLEAADPAAVLGALYPGLADSPASSRLPVPGALRREVVTGRDGAFDFAWGDHPDGSGHLVLTALKAGFRDTRSEVRAARTSVVLELAPERRGAAIELVSGDGRPLPDKVLWYLDGVALAAPDDLLEGRYQVRVRRGAVRLVAESEIELAGLTRLLVQAP
ncbi:MAG TPA: hypothetical protein VGC54_08550 [Planctomycetota bacterium]